MSPPLSVDEALERILESVEPTAVEFGSIEAAHRRTLAQQPLRPAVGRRRAPCIPGGGHEAARAV